MIKLAMALVSACGIAAGTMPAGAAPTPGGLAFDQIERTIVSGERPSPTSFKADYELALRVATNGPADPAAAIRGAASGSRGVSMVASAASMIPGAGGLFGGIAAAAAARAQQAAMRNRIKSALNDALQERTAGTLTHYAFLHGWQRTEKPGISAIIVKPDLQQTIYLDLRKKTFTRYGYVEQPAADPTAGGTGTLQSSVSVRAFAADAIDGHPIDAAESAYHALLTGGSGACEDGTSEVRAKIYYARDVALPAQLATKEAVGLESMALQPGCAPKIVRQGDVQRNAHLALFRIVDVNGGAAPDSASGGAGGTFAGGGALGGLGGLGGIGKLGGLPGLGGLGAIRRSVPSTSATASAPGQRNYTSVVERGNLTVLGPNDAALFEVPADFTEGK